MDKQLTWREIKALNQLYYDRNTKAKIDNRPYIKYLIEDGFIDYKRGTKKILQPTYKFNKKFESECFSELYNGYNIFLLENNLLSDYTNFTEFEIKGLMTLIKSQTILQDLQSKILAGQESRKGVSTLFFKSAKYIRKNSALEKAVLKLLNIETFPQNENQGFYRVPSKNPKAIILCENMYFLTLNIAQSNDIELWCAGGNNTKPIENIPKIDYPIFYLCDWDYDGLKIFERLLEIVEKTPTKKTSLQLLSPKGKRENIIATHDHHRSQWKQEIKFSGLTPSCYTSEQIQLINNLIVNNEWIEEESNDLGLIINKINSELAR